MRRNASAREKIREDLESLTAELIGLGLADDQNFPSSKQTSDRLWEISFQGANNISIALSGSDYEVIYDEMLSNRSFNVKLIDGGLLQLSYRFEHDTLIKHRLGFYPSPKLHSFQGEPEQYLKEELYIDIVSRRIIPFPVRFDYDVAAARDIAHPHCHLTLGDVEGCRIPVYCPLTPSQFVEFVIRNFYQTERYEFVSKLPPPRHSFDMSISQNERSLIHLAVPTPS